MNGAPTETRTHSKMLEKLKEALIKGGNYDTI